MNAYIITIAVIVSASCLGLGIWIGWKFGFRIWQKAFVWTAYSICLFNILYVGVHFAEGRFHARDRERLKMTMRNMKDWAMAWETYYVAKSTYAPENQQVSPSFWENISAEQIIQMLIKENIDSQLITKLTPKDAWSHDIQFCVLGYGSSSEYFIRSAGQDGSWDAQRYFQWPYDEGDFDADIVMGNGQFYRWMEGSAMTPYPDSAPHKIKDREVVPRFSDLR